MTTMSADTAPLVVVDTNVLLAATDRSRSQHDAAIRFLNEDARRLAVSPQIVREYLAVTSRPVAVNGLGLSGEDAVGNIEQFLEGMEMLAEGPGTTRSLMDLIVAGPTVGKQVHDANVVAVALAHRAVAIVTDNTRHFARFAQLVVIEEIDGTVVTA
ncbi:Predicted nucleic acid-binding protein, contains PIN domain [Nocardioides psychrotolerans]|uniref:Ribonuclease VapC n=2 Tax=Nocardioides psychrotolerans TaxID=1005945 RepID=A0A1I3RRP8_9ACTN|nr:Predicted nucleic acid-binding protein, contains PIN domain [Nocardioides psychrotolerans]